MGLALTYAGYARAKDDPVLTPFTTGLGNNSVELIAVLAIVPTLFSFFPLDEVLSLMAESNEGLIFVTLPGLFQQIPAGRAFAVLFFLCLSFAACTSLVAMLELGVRFLTDLRLSRPRAVLLAGAAGLVFAIPSAVSMDFFKNQDTVWSIGLLTSGFFFSLLFRRIGMNRFEEEFLPFRSRTWRGIFAFLILWMIPLEFLFLMSWWLYQVWDRDGWWNPLAVSSFGTCLFQWGILLGVLLLFNRRISRRIGGPA